MASGPIGLIDAELVRYLASVRHGQLRVHVSESLYPALFLREHLELFLSALEVVDGIDVCCQEPCMHIPHRQLAAYSEDRLFKRVDVRSSCCAAQAKLCTPDELRGSRAAAVVSGSFDVLHPGHVRLMQQAKAQADVLVVAMQSTSSLLLQPKNRCGDRPIYSEDDRVAVVAALSCVDHVVLFDESDCAPVLDALRPSVYVKHERDRGRTAVEREAKLVRATGGRVVYVEHSSFDFSSREIVETLRSTCRASSRTQTPRRFR